MDLYSLNEKRKSGLFTILTYIIVYMILTSFIYAFLESIMGSMSGYSTSVLADMYKIYVEHGVTYMREQGHGEFADFYIRVECIAMAISYLLTLAGLYFITRKYIFADFQKRYSNRTIGYYIGVYLAVFYGITIVSNILITAIGDYVILNDHIFHAKEFLERGSVNQESIVVMLKSSVGVLLFLTAGIVGPIVEELVYRKGIFNIFKNQWVGLVVSSIIFGMIHIISSITEGYNFIAIVITGLPYIISGFAFGFVYIKSGHNVVVTSAIHIISNLFSMIMVLMAPENPVEFIVRNYFCII